MGGSTLIPDGLDDDGGRFGILTPLMISFNKASTGASAIPPSGFTGTQTFHQSTLFRSSGFGHLDGHTVGDTLVFQDEMFFSGQTSRFVQ